MGRTVMIIYTRTEYECLKSVRIILQQDQFTNRFPVSSKYNDENDFLLAIGT